MIARNIEIDQLGSVLKGKRIIPFGAGAWLKALEIPELQPYRRYFSYVIDSNPNKTVVRLFSDDYSVYAPDKIRDETEKTVVVLCSPIYQLEMFEQLRRMELGDNIEVISLPFLAIQQPPIDTEKINRFIHNNGERIPKVIHSFWFSGDEKPENYRKCVDSWYEKCLDYKIIEWNLDNYHSDNPFFNRAIELGSWAYATDYARLDVISRLGGWYMDMDVEVFRPFDDFLSNKAVFSFSNRCFIDTAIFGAERGNKVVKRLVNLYDNVELPYDRDGFKKYFPPVFERDVFREEGIIFDGSLQKTDNMTVVPGTFFMPLDFVFFNDFETSEYTYAVHYDNFGWGNGKDVRSQKRNNNTKLMELFKNFDNWNM